MNNLQFEGEYHDSSFSLHGYNNMPQNGLNGLIGMYLFEKVVIVK